MDQYLKYQEGTSDTWSFSHALIPNSPFVWMAISKSSRTRQIKYFRAQPNCWTKVHSDISILTSFNGHWAQHSCRINIKSKLDKCLSWWSDRFLHHSTTVRNQPWNGTGKTEIIWKKRPSIAQLKKHYKLSDRKGTAINWVNNDRLLVGLSINVNVHKWTILS